MVEADFDLLTRLNSPTLRLIPRRALGQFARVWGSLLLKAVATATHENWFSALAFPRCVLVATPRGGNRVTRSVTQVVLDRIRRWSEDPRSVFAEAQLRSRGPAPPTRAPPSAASLEKAALAALRLNDVKKALQVLTSAPFAPPGPATVKALLDLHPSSPPPPSLPHPVSKAPFFDPI